MYSLGKMDSVNFTSPKTRRLQLKLSLENFPFKSLYAVQSPKTTAKLITTTYIAFS